MIFFRGFAAAWCLLALCAFPALAGEWRDVEWEGFRFSVPGEWKELSGPAQREVGFGRVEADGSPPRVVFGGYLHPLPLAQDPPFADDAPPRELGRRKISGRGAVLYAMQGAPEGLRMDFRALCLEEPLADGNFLCLMGGVVDLDWEDQGGVLERIFSSLGAPLPEQ